MKNNHYKLIKLSIELTALFPYSFDSEDIEVKDFELIPLIEGLELYIEATDFVELENDIMNKEELLLLGKIIALIKTIKNELLEDKINDLLENNNNNIDIIAFDPSNDIQVLDINISSIIELDNNINYKNFLNNYNINDFITRYDYKMILELEAIKK